jgi:CheY-like chemotaxis protein
MNDIIDISVIELDLMKVDIKESDINEQTGYIYSFFKPEIEKKGIQLSVKNSLPSKEAVIKTDPEKLSAVLINLVKNAVRYTNEGSIEVGYNKITDRESVELEFFVKDTGIGIPKERHEAIFEEFATADTRDKNAFQGAGQGLSISKAYVEMLGGKIRVESEPDKGTIFYFTIPYITETNEKADTGNIVPVGQAKGQIKNLKILIVEDDSASEMLISMAVKMFCKEILKAKTGVGAIEAFRNNPDIDLVFMDIQMSEMDGYEATKGIRKFNKDVVIIAQTAFALPGDREKCLEAGCNDYITKPIQKGSLAVLIQEYFK